LKTIELDNLEEGKACIDLHRDPVRFTYKGEVVGHAKIVTTPRMVERLMPSYAMNKILYCVCKTSMLFCAIYDSEAYIIQPTEFQ